MGKALNIEIIRLSPELTNDYIEYFDKIAFLENQEWAGCYCVWYHWNELLENEYREYAANGGKKFKRNLAVNLIQNGLLQGYLAYADGSVAGWCNANNKTSYDRLRHRYKLNNTLIFVEMRIISYFLQANALFI